MKQLRALLPLLLVIASACGGVDPSSDELGVLEQGLEHTDCTVDYNVVAQFEGGFQANVSVRNDGAASTSWRVTWTFRDGQTVDSAFGAVISQNGSDVTANSVSFNGALSAGNSANFGFIGEQSGTNRIRSLECTMFN
jgi:cellulase/cellobiase CelA1